MKVSVLINIHAGQTNPELIERKIREALFRCDIHVFRSSNIEDMKLFILQQMERKTECFIICGGDGTINASLQVLLSLNQSLPNICLISSGTANDLVHELNVTQKIDKAARLILEGKIRFIDVIQIESEGLKKYMLTNGGLGIPALAAEKANGIRRLLQQKKTGLFQDGFAARKAFELTQKLIKKIGPQIYTVLLAQSWREWKNPDWQIEIEFPYLKKKISTEATIIMINNQSVTAGSYLTAPYTENNDGHMNLLMVEEKNKFLQAMQIYQIAQGKVDEYKNRVFESSEFIIRSKFGKPILNFFGDGETLFTNVSQLHLKCLKQKVPIVVKN